ncbi:hypothetical protein VP01_3988g1 [Puccinia sorghi]|uniref:Uncharacterized protein n=1 Tax=Puccinia sorghi TaxID=27349 RepID=A0A0L6UT23_9BASI|nr:hypothetical protein VP01_3988g1 [Puccinia sorghi]
MDTPVPTPESIQFNKKEGIKLPDERKGIMLDTRKQVEKVVSMHGAGGQDVAFQLPIMIIDRKISEAIENMEGQKTRDWELSKKELICKWGQEVKKDDSKTVENESTGKLTQLQEEINKLRPALNTSQNTRALPPHFALPRQPAVVLRPMGGGSYQRPQIQCYYCKEAAQTVMFCPHLTADLDKKLLFKQGPNYYYPNCKPITETGDST